MTAGGIALLEQIERLTADRRVPGLLLSPEDFKRIADETDARVEGCHNDENMMVMTPHGAVTVRHDAGVPVGEVRVAT